MQEAIRAYERLMRKDSGARNRFLIPPFYHFHLAKLYEQKQWVGKASEQYQKFLQLTRHADKFLSERKEAKVRYIKLTGTH